MPLLSFVPKQEFDRLESLTLSPHDRARLFATMCRLNTLYMIARAGSGHIGSSFSSLDIVSWLFLNELELSARSEEPRDIYFSSKGHDVPGLYAVLIARGLLPFDKLHTLRRLGGLPGHPDVATPFAFTNTGPLGMGISKAKGMVAARRLKSEKGRVFVLTGDGELQEGQFWESLVSAANHGLGEITAIIDHNKVQSDTWVERVSALGELEDKLRAFGWHVARVDGHDLEAIARVLTTFRKVADRPKVLIADTVKGRGVSFMESTAMKPDEKLYRFHSGAPDDDTYQRGVAELVATANAALAQAGASPLKLEQSERPARADMDRAQRLVPAYSRALVAEAERNSHIVALDADLVLDTGLIPFSERFPERFVECGISEQDMVSQAGGMALRGMLPIVHSFACFLSTRPNEQIYNNATERTKVLYVGSLAGLIPSGPGHSHQCVRDIASLGGIPHFEMLEPSCEAEVALAVDYLVNRTRHSGYLRLVSVPCNIPYELPSGYRLSPGRGAVLRDGTDVLVLGYGPVLLAQAYHAATELEGNGVSVRLVNLPWLNRVDPEWLADVARGVEHVFTLDNHYVQGGQGQLVAATLSLAGLHLPVTLLGVTDIPACGQNDEALRAHALDAAGIAASVMRAVRGGAPTLPTGRGREADAGVATGGLA